MADTTPAGGETAPATEETSPATENPTPAAAESTSETPSEAAPASVETPATEGQAPADPAEPPAEDEEPRLDAKELAESLADERKTADSLRQKLEEAKKTHAAKEAALQREIWLQKLYRLHPELEEAAEFLTADSEKGLKEQAERLLGVRGKQPQEGNDPHRPTPNLSPGHGEEIDDAPSADEIADRVWRRTH